jgi:hypothetical protein
MALGPPIGLSIVAVSTCDARSLELSGHHQGGSTDVEGVGPRPVCTACPRLSVRRGQLWGAKPEVETQGLPFHPGVTGWEERKGECE